MVEVAQEQEPTTTPAIKTVPGHVAASPSKKLRIIASDEVKLLIKRLRPEAQLPKRSSPHAAGYDLHSAVDTVVPARGKALVSTGIALDIPAGHYGRVAPRSGLAAKHSIDVGAGVIDVDYRGELMVLLFNFGESDFAVKQGDRVAQLIIERISNPVVEEVEELSETVRGGGGFGSTGV